MGRSSPVRANDRATVRHFDVHVVEGRILLCTCGEMTEPARRPDDMWRAFEAHQALVAAHALEVCENPPRHAPRAPSPTGHTEHGTVLRNVALDLTIGLVALCIVGVVAAVVVTGRDGRLAYELTLLAMGALVVAWRLDSGVQRDQARSAR